MKEIVTNVINEWDPLDLFPYAPADEYELEIMTIVEYLESEEHYSVKELGTKIYELFIKTLGSDVFTKTLDSCIEVAEKLIA